MAYTNIYSRDQGIQPIFEGIHIIFHDPYRQENLDFLKRRRADCERIVVVIPFAYHIPDGCPCVRTWGNNPDILI
jgi:hypothetical protein